VRELQVAFGPALHRELTRLARRALATPVSQPATVFLLPGILGTQLGLPRSAPLPPDLLWLDPQDLTAGRLTCLRSDAAPLVTLGALPLSYLALQLRLQAAGYEVMVHDYDWRSDLRTQAAALVARLRAWPRPAMLIGHSMGGLIARAALGECDPAQLQRLVLLGVPNAGAFGAVQALRGSYPVVRRLAALDRLHDAEWLAHEVFASFNSLYQMLPTAAATQAQALHEGTLWPVSGPQPDAGRLAAARGYLESLPPPDARCCAIAGAGQRTVVGIDAGRDEFIYLVNSAGDGTVPLASATLPGLPTWYLRCEHSALPRDPRVGRALLELLATGNTARLARTPPRHATRLLRVGDRALARNWNDKLDWAAMAPDDRRLYLEQLNLSPPQYFPPARAPRR
jgi:pimeloyl-ACP methyl ester carboxylesterase